MKTQAILLSTVGFAALATAGTANGNGMEPTTAVVTVQPIPTVIETISPTSPQPSDNASPLLAKRPDLDKRSDDDDDCVPGSIAPLDLTCEDFSEDVKCHSKSHLKHPFGDREDYYVSCIQWCRKRSGLNRYIFYKGRYLDMTLEEYDEWIRNGAESNTATAAVPTTTEPAATVTVWTNLATTNQPPPSVKTGAKTTTKAVANTTSWDVKVKSTGFQTSFRTISSSAPLASSSVLLGERSTTEADCHHKAAGQQKCRTKCGWGGGVRKKCYDKCMAKWSKKHCSNNADGALTERAEDTNTTKINNSVIVEREVQSDNHDNHHCNNDSVQRHCHWKASFHVFDKEKHYNRCIQKCVRKHNGDNYGFPDEEGDDDYYSPEEEEGGDNYDSPDKEGDDLTKRSGGITPEELGIRNPGLDYPCDSAYWMTLCNAANVWTIKEHIPQPSYLNCMAQCEEMHRADEAEKAEKAKQQESGGGSLGKRSGAVDEATTVLDAGLANMEAEAEGGACDAGTWANAWCGVKASWSWHRQKAFDECIDECRREHSLDAMVTKRSINETADNDTTLDTSKIATVSLTKRDDFPYNGQLGEANDDDNHHCNNTWVQVKCSAKSMLTFWSFEKHYFRCIAKCVIERDGDNWTEGEQ